MRTERASPPLPSPPVGDHAPPSSPGIAGETTWESLSCAQTLMQTIWSLFTRFWNWISSCFSSVESAEVDPEKPYFRVTEGQFFDYRFKEGEELSIQLGKAIVPLVGLNVDRDHSFRETLTAIMQREHIHGISMKDLRNAHRFWKEGFVTDSTLSFSHDETGPLCELLTRALQEDLSPAGQEALHFVEESLIMSLIDIEGIDVEGPRGSEPVHDFLGRVQEAAIPLLNQDDEKRDRFLAGLKAIRAMFPQFHIRKVLKRLDETRSDRDSDFRREVISAIRGWARENPRPSDWPNGGEFSISLPLRVLFVLVGELGVPVPPISVRGREPTFIFTLPG